MMIVIYTGAKLLLSRVLFIFRERHGFSTSFSQLYTLFRRLRSRPDCARFAFAAWLYDSIFGSKIDFSWETSPTRKRKLIEVANAMHPSNECAKVPTKENVMKGIVVAKKNRIIAFVTLSWIKHALIANMII